MATRRKPRPKPPRPKGPKSPTTYSYLLGPKGVLCFTSSQDHQSVGRLWEASSLSSFHDEALATATKEINAILDQVEKSKPSEDAVLSFVGFQGQQFLVWASYGAIGPDDDDDVIAEALGLKEPKGRKRT